MVSRRPLTNPARDLKSGLDVEAGTQQMDGETALAYARSRSYQELIGGSWKSIDGSDIGRTPSPARSPASDV